MAVLEVDRRQVLAYRTLVHGLTRDTREVTRLGVLDLGVQDTPPGSAMLALSARLPDAPDASALAMAWSHRGAPHLHRPGELPALAEAIWPLSDEDAEARLTASGRSIREAGITGLTALTEAAKAMREAVKGPTTKGEASGAVTKRLPAGLSGWCRGCAVTHVNEQLFRLSALPAGLCIEPGRSPLTFVPTKGRRGVPKRAAGTETVVSSYLRLLGPATATDVAGFFATKAKLMSPAWPDGLAEIRVSGRKTWIPQADLDALIGAERPKLVRLLPPSDPFLQARDRSTLLPDKSQQAVLWRNLGRGGAVMVDAEITGVWNARGSGKRRLEIEVTPFAKLSAPVRRALDDEAARVGAVRGVDDVVVSYAS